MFALILIRIYSMVEIIMKSKNSKKTIRIVLVLLFVVSGFTVSINSEQESFYSDVGGLEPERYSTIQEVQIDKNNTEYIWNTSPVYQLQKTTSDSIDYIAYSNEHIENFGNNRNDKSCWQSNLFENNILSIQHDNEVENKQDTSPVSFYTYNPQDYTDHAPIVIEGDENFTEENGVTGGSGTKNDPYIIEGWKINKATAVSIEKTSSYFVIRDCLFDVESGSGFAIISMDWYTSNGTIQNVILNSSKNPRYRNNGILIGPGSSNIKLENLWIAAYQGIYFAYLGGSEGFVYEDVINRNISIDNCSIYHCGEGIHMRYCESVSISNTSISVYDPFNSPHLLTGFDMGHCDQVSIKDCEISHNELVFDMDSCSHYLLRNNNIYDNDELIQIFWNIAMYYGFYAPGVSVETDLACFDHDIDTSNLVDGKPIYYLRNESDITIDGSIYDISFLVLYNCDNVTVRNVDSIKIFIIGSENNTIESCQPVEQSQFGFLLFHSSKNIIRDCHLRDTGMMMFFSSLNILRNNTFTIDDYSHINFARGGFFVYGNQTEEYAQDIDTSNIINNKPMKYLVGQKDHRISSDDFGYLALVNCKNIEVVNVKVQERSQGLLIANTTDSVIKKCTFLQNIYGIFIFDSYDVTVSNCVFKRQNNIGIGIDSSHDIEMIRCQGVNNGVHVEMKLCSECTVGMCYFGYYCCFQLVHSYENFFFLNTIASQQFMYINGGGGNEICYNKLNRCLFGLELFHGTGNNIHHNDFLSNMDTAIYLYETIEDTVHHNNIKNTGGLGLEGEGISLQRSENVSINYNNIQGNTVGVEAYLYHSDLNVQHNYWGSRDGAAGYGSGDGDILDAHISGDETVSYEPYLKKPVYFNRILGGLIYYLNQEMI